MKVAFVLGFFDRVESALRAEFGNHFESNNLVWVGQQSISCPLNFNLFKSRFLPVIGDGSNDDVLVALARARGQEWVEQSVRSLIDSVDLSARVQFLAFDDVQNSQRIIENIRQFGLPTRNEEISENALRTYLNGSQVLCVRGSFQSAFEDVLARANIPFASCRESFIERIISPSQNSNLVYSLREAADQFDLLLYAWKGLRHLPPKVKNRYKRSVLTGESTAVVVAMLKKEILEQQKKGE